MKEFQWLMDFFPQPEIIKTIVGMFVGGGFAALIVGLILLRLERRNIRISHLLNNQSRVHMRFSEVAMTSQFSIFRAATRRTPNQGITREERLILFDNEAKIRSLTRIVHLYFQKDQMIGRRVQEYLELFVSLRRRVGQKQFERPEFESDQDRLNDISIETLDRMDSIIETGNPCSQEMIDELLDYTKRGREEDMEKREGESDEST